MLTTSKLKYDEKKDIYMVSKYISHKLLFVTKRKTVTLQYRSSQTSPEPMIKGNVAKNGTDGQQVPPDTML